MKKSIVKAALLVVGGNYNRHRGHLALRRGREARAAESICSSAGTKFGSRNPHELNPLTAILEPGKFYWKFLSPLFQPYRPSRSTNLQPNKTRDFNSPFFFCAHTRF